MNARFGELTWPEAGSAKGAIALLPCGAVEAHGPHLPLLTDVVIAETAALRAAAMLLEPAFRASDAPRPEHPGREAESSIAAVVLPPLVYAVADYAGEFPGTLSISAETASALVADVCRAAARSGLAGVVLCNAHLDPAHIASLVEGQRRAEADGVRVAFPDITRKPHALRLGDEFRSGACHAGRFETSLVLAARPDLVRDSRHTLPENPASLSVAIRKGLRTFHQAGGPEAYFGAPASATASEGESLYDTLADIFAESARNLGIP